MKRLMASLLVCFLLTVITETVWASRIIWSSVSVQLDSLIFYPSDNLHVILGDSSSSGFVSNKGEIGVTDTKLLCSSEIWLEDLLPYSGPGFAYSAYAHTGLSYTQEFIVEDSGYLDASIQYHFGYDHIPWARPDDDGTGPADAFEVWLRITNSHGEFAFDMGTGAEGAIGPISRDGIVDTRGGPGDVYFENGESGFVSIHILSLCAGRYIDLPTPVPEPTTMLLLGSGLLGLLGLGKKFRK